MPTCPEGHASTSNDYCDVCGSPVRTAAVQPITPVSATDESLPRVRGADQRPLLRGVRTRLGAARTGATPQPAERGNIGRMDGRRHRRPGVLRSRPRPRRP